MESSVGRVATSEAMGRCWWGAGPAWRHQVAFEALQWKMPGPQWPAHPYRWAVECSRTPPWSLGRVHLHSWLDVETLLYSIGNRHGTSAADLLRLEVVLEHICLVRSHGSAHGLTKWLDTRSHLNEVQADFSPLPLYTCTSRPPIYTYIHIYIYIVIYHMSYVMISCMSYVICHMSINHRIKNHPKIFA